jgi:2-haloacid dehalogenase
MATTLAFDVYGTLIDTDGVVEKLTRHVGDLSVNFANTWRNKQLEYSFRRGLMKNYVKFSVCTQQALDYTCEYFDVALSPKQKEDLLNQYNNLPAFSDVIEALTSLRASGHNMYAFSNGDPVSVEAVLTSAGLRDYFEGIISVDDLKTFKPNPDVYHYFLEKSGADISHSWLISSNPFDIIGALNTGIKAAWLRRSRKMIFDPWDYHPTVTINTLPEFSSYLDESLR